MLTIEIARMLSGPKKWTFSLERGRGQTYAHPDPTLYGHSEYERGSVLEGQPQRVFLSCWDTLEEAQKELAEVKASVPAFKYDDDFDAGISSHIDVERMVSHLPDDTDY